MGYASGAKRSATARAIRMVHWLFYYIWLGLLAARVAIVVALLCLIAFNMIVVRAQAQAAPAKPNYAKAYGYALRCFAVNGDDSESGARAAYDAGKKLGRLQWLSDQRITQDFKKAIAIENVKIAQDGGYRQSLLAQCRQLGLAN